MIAFEPTEEQKMISLAVASFAKDVLRPKLREHEAARAVDEPTRRIAFELGFGTAGLSEAAGGAGVGLGTLVLMEEEAAYGDSAASLGFGGPGLFGLALTELADEETQKRLLAPFVAEGGHARFAAVAWGERNTPSDPDAAHLPTRASKTEDGYAISGQKAYVGNAGLAETILVFAEIDPAKRWEEGGLGAFVVRASEPGVSVVERHDTLGLDAANFGVLRFDGVTVKEADRIGEGERFGAGLARFFAKAALLVAARQTGLSRAALDTTREYVETRKAFGKPIGHFQAVAFTVADRAIDVEAAKVMVLRAAAAWDSNENDAEALLVTAQAVSFCHEAAMRAAGDGVQLFGGAGFMRDYPLEKWMRDAKQLAVTGLTAEQADQLALACELGGPLDLSSILPSGDAQSTFL